MKYIYTEKDLDLVSWKKIDQFIDKIYVDVKEYIDNNNLKIKYICPILRGGAVPAVKLSHMLNVIDMLPIQLRKKDSTTTDIEIKLGLDYIKNPTIGNNECILLVEGNHYTGSSANTAVKLIKDKFGNDTKIIYVSLTRDYTHRNSVEGTCYTAWAMTTNETKGITEEECKELGISNLATIFPWENIDEELFEMNN